MNLVLFGIKKCGKTFLGKKIAAQLKRAFIDTDDLVEKEYQIMQKKRLSCRDIYREVGPVKFRIIEQEVVHSLQDVQRSVIAAGGGTMLSLDNSEALSRHGILVYLTEEKETLKKRLFEEDDFTPLLDPKDPDASFERMYSERDAAYRRLNAIEFPLTQLAEQESVDKLCALALAKEKKDGK